MLAVPISNRLWIDEGAGVRLLRTCEFAVGSRRNRCLWKEILVRWEIWNSYKLFCDVRDCTDTQHVFCVRESIRSAERAQSSSSPTTFVAFIFEFILRHVHAASHSSHSRRWFDNLGCMLIFNLTLLSIIFYQNFRHSRWRLSRGKEKWIRWLCRELFCHELCLRRLQQLRFGYENLKIWKMEIWMLGGV